MAKVTTQKQWKLVITEDELKEKFNLSKDLKLKVILEDEGLFPIGDDIAKKGKVITVIFDELDNTKQ